MLGRQGYGGIRRQTDVIMAAAKGNGKQGQQTEKWSLFGTKTVEKTANGKKKVVVKVRLAAGGLCEHVCMKDDESVERDIMAHSPWLTGLKCMDCVLDRPRTPRPRRPCRSRSRRRPGGMPSTSGNPCSAMTR
jgi:hypothetical protein